jgi:iron complex outermembrane receptor protein
MGTNGLLVAGRPMEVVLTVENLLDHSYRDYLSRYKLFVDNPGRDVTLRMRLPLGAAH